MPLAAAAFPVNSCSSQGSVCNLCSATLGAGALSLPYGFRHASVGVATLMLLLAGGATVYSIWLLIYVYEKTGIRTYEESTESLAGRPLRRFVEALTIVFCYGCAVAYVTAVGDVLAPLTHVFPSLSREGLMVAFWTVFMLPPSCSRVVDSLRFTSFFGMCAMVWLTVAVMWHAAAGSRHPDRPHPPPAVDVWAVRWDLLVSTPIVLFAYTCQINVFAIYDELCPQTPRAMVRVSTWGIALCFAIYFLIGLAGYADFGAQTQGNILNNYAPTLAQSSWVVQSAFVATALAITMAFPLVVHPLRASLNLLLLDKPQLRGSTHYLETLSLSVAILAAALFVPGVNVVFQLLGATTSSLLCFIIPAYLGYKADCHKQGIGHAACIVGVLVLGCCIGVLGSAVTVQGLLWPQG